MVSLQGAQHTQRNQTVAEGVYYLYHLVQAAQRGLEMPVLLSTEAGDLEVLGV